MPGEDYADQRDMENMLLSWQCICVEVYECVSEWYQSLTAHQHRKGHTVPKTGLNCQVTSWKKSSNEQGNAHYGPRSSLIMIFMQNTPHNCDPRDYYGILCLIMKISVT